MKQLLSQLATPLLVSTLGGLTALFSKKLQSKQPFGILQTVGQLTLAIFSGFLAHFLCCQSQIAAPGTNWYIICIAIAGYAGRPLLKVLDKVIIAKAKGILKGKIGDIK